jgi:hypothetical protein
LLPTRAAASLNDSFDVGFPATRTNDVADPSDAYWWSAQGTANLSVVADSGGINNGNALFVETGNGGNGRQVLANQFGTVSLGTSIGDTVRLSFAFRFTSIGRGSGTTVRFGLYDDSGTTLMADNQKPRADDDRGYWAEFGFGDTSTAGVFRENGVGGAILDGTDMVNLTTNSSPIAINDMLAHTAAFTLTRSGSNTIHLNLTIDGVSRAEGENYPLILTTFNELAFLNNAKALDYRLDNVVIDAVPVPEPNAVTLLGLGALGLAIRSHRRRSGWTEASGAG